jgi:hypothetical protein
MTIRSSRTIADRWTKGAPGPHWSAITSIVPLHRACGRKKSLPTVRFIADHRGPADQGVALCGLAAVGLAGPSRLDFGRGWRV